MPLRYHANNFRTTLNGSITAVATSMTLTSVTGLPDISGGGEYWVTMSSGALREIIKVTARTGFVLTIVRAQESTTAQAFPSGCQIELRVTANSIDRKMDGAASSVDNSVPRFDGTTGKVFQSSLVDIDDTNNLKANNLAEGYTTTVTAAGTTTLTLASTGQQFFTGATAQTLVLPVVSTLYLGFSFNIVNTSTGVITINSSGGNLVLALAASTSATITCILATGTTAASWLVAYSALAGGGVGAAVGGADTQVQYNAAGLLGGNSGFTYDATNNITYANNLRTGYATTVTAAGTTTLLVNSARQQYFTGTTTQTVALPVAATLSLGQSFVIVNNSTGIVTVNSSGGNLVLALAASTSATITCILTSGTTAASWSSAYTALGVSNGDKGDITVASSGTVWTVDTPSSVTLAVDDKVLVKDTSAADVMKYGTTQAIADMCLNTAGNYVVAGTDVAVTDGGTGVSTLTTAYAPVCAGTTATGPLQVAATGMANSGYVLTSTGASSLATWQAPATGGVSGSVLELITTQTVSSVANLNITGLGDYSYVEFVLLDFAPATDADQLYIRTSTDNGATYDSGATDYMYQARGMNNVGTAIEYNGGAGQAFLRIGQAQGNAANEFCNGRVTLFNPTAANYKHFTFALSTMSVSTATQHNNGGGARMTAADVDAVRFYYSTGNIASATIYVYGLKKVTPGGASGTLTSSEVTGTTQAAAANYRYVTNNASQVNTTLPATAAIGDRVLITGKGAGGWKLTANTGQIINVGSSATSSGGSLGSAHRYDCIEVVCVTANTTWVMQNSVTAGFNIL